MKKFRVQITVVWYEPYEWEKEKRYYDSEQEYIDSIISSIKEDGLSRLDWRADIDYSNTIVEVVDEQRNM